MRLIRENLRIGWIASLGVVLLSIWMGPQEATAITRDWNGSIDSLFGRDGNWSPAGVPTSGDAIRFGLSGVHEVSFDASRSTGPVTFSLGEMAWLPEDVMGADDIILETAGQNLISGGTLQIEGRVGREFTWQLDGDLFVSKLFGSGMSRFRIGSDSMLLQTAGRFQVGSSRGGALDIVGGEIRNMGGEVSIGEGANSNGLATLNGLNSSWQVESMFRVGRKNLATGRLEILQGGQLDTNESAGLGARIGDESGSAGEVLVMGLPDPDGDGPETAVESIWTNLGFMHVGKDGMGTLELQAGGVVENTTVGITDAEVSVGTGPAGMGVISIDGLGSRFSTGERLKVGIEGIGEINVTNAGKLESGFTQIGMDTDGNGTITVDGTGSTWDASVVDIGRGGLGKVEVLNGGKFTSISAEIGDTTGGEGEVEVSGESSLWEAGILTIGPRGKGTLTIRDGGAVAGGLTIVSDLSGASGEVKVEGAASTWTADQLRIGKRGLGTLDVTDGGAVISESGWVGESAGAAGIVTVAGNGARWQVNDDLILGGTSGASGGTGRITLEDDGNLEIRGNLTMYAGSRIILDGGVLIANQLSEPTGGEVPGAIDWNRGTLRITGEAGLRLGDTPFINASQNLSGSQFLEITEKLVITTGNQLSAKGGNIVVGQAEIAPGGTWTILGGIQDFGAGLLNEGSLALINASATGNITGTSGGEVTLVNGATFNGIFLGAGNLVGSGTATFTGGFGAADGAGSLDIEVDVTLTETNTFFVEIGGTSAGSEFDQVVIDADIDISGRISIALIDGFTPEIGSRFEVLKFDNRIGDFSEINGEFVTQGTFWVKSWEDNTLVLTLTAIAGDANLDGLVTTIDLAIWDENIGRSSNVGFEDGDFDGDGDVDGFDFQVWQQHFGQSVNGGGNGSALSEIPESTTLLGLALGTFIIGTRRLRT